MKKIYFLISAAVIVFDQFTKYLIIQNIMPFEAIHVFPFFNIVNVSNKGAAFGSLQFMGNPFFIIISLIAISAVIYLLVKGIENPLALSFILGGALGNLIDRLRLGYVVDFLDVFIGEYHWPSFNVADSFLSIGIFLILLTNVISLKKSSPPSD